MFNLDPSAATGSSYGIYLVGVILIVVIGGLVALFKNKK